MDLDISMKQTQNLSPQMVQAMKILRMGAQELTQYLEEAAEENPVLEVEISCGVPEQVPELCRRLEWLAAGDVQNGCYHRQDAEEAYEALEHYGVTDDREESLYRHIAAQLQGLNLEPELAACAGFLAADLDRNGWLSGPLEVLAAEIHQPLSRMERALEVLQSLEPAGVAARDLLECLCLQLLRLRPVDKLALAIATDHLDALAKHHYGYIARQLEADQEAVERSCRLIRTLNPRPASRFESLEHVVYITPDVIATVRGGRLELVANDRIVPVLGISAYYTRMLKAGDVPEVREYLTEKVRQAKYLLQAVEQRKSTLLACARCIAEIQQDFFRKGAGSLVPMSLQDVARRVGIHESTVSRAVGNKYLQCPSGLYPFRVFFSRGLGGETGGKASPDAAKALLKELIQQEDKARPLSDQKLCGRMAAQGCAISRRTVAKYCGELQIPGMSQRRTKGG